MNTVIDNVASALYEYQKQQYPESSTAKREFYDQGIYHDAARVALTAMREPTNDQANEYFKLRKAVGDIDATACLMCPYGKHD